MRRSQLRLPGMEPQDHILRKRYREYRARVNNTYLAVNGTGGNNPAGAQCVNVWNCWREALGLPWQPGNARDMIGEADAFSLWVQNTPTGVPPFGAGVMLYGPGVSPDGHVFVCGEADTRGMWGLSQDWPEGSDVHVVRFGYEVCVGWRVPILQDARMTAVVHSVAAQTLARG